ncbi:MAG: DUF1287 domain-containing protein [Verrucomicrobiota bacterium]
MARRHKGFYDTIEYIGPRPSVQKKSGQGPFGGWVIVVIAISVAAWFVMPMASSFARASDRPTVEHAASLIGQLRASASPGRKLAAAALEYSGRKVSYDPSYYAIGMPQGDVPAGKGMAEDLIVRTFRKTGVDLQQLVNDDMRESFRVYPQLWEASGPDANIDHRRTANLRRFFERKGESIEPTTNPSNFELGDVVVWSLPPNAEQHIGIVVPGPGMHSGEPWVVHHLADGLKWENALFDYKIEAQLRYPAVKEP